MYGKMGKLWSASAGFFYANQFFRFFLTQQLGHVSKNHEFKSESLMIS